MWKEIGFTTVQFFKPYFCGSDVVHQALVHLKITAYFIIITVYFDKLHSMKNNLQRTVVFL